MLRPLFPAGTGGASPLGGFGIPGTAGAPPNGGCTAPPEGFPMTGADLSFVTAFLSALPFEMSERSAPLPAPAGGLEGRFPGGGGGGGGGPPMPGIGGGGGGGGGGIVDGCSSRVSRLEV